MDFFNFQLKHKPNPFLEAVKNGEWDSVIKSIAEDESIVHAMDDQGNTALMLAIMSQKPSSIDMAKFLILKGVNVNVADKNGYTAIMNAVLYNKLQLLPLLIESGANVNAITRYHNHVPPTTALIIAVQWNNIAAAKFLIKNKADVNMNFQYGGALMHAVHKDNIEMVELLIEAGAKINIHDKSFQNWTPLMQAASKGNQALVKLLLQNGADVSAVEAALGCPVLTLVAFDGAYPDIVDLLIQYGAKVDFPSLINGATALMMASRMNKGTKMVEKLIYHGAGVNAKNKEGCTPLMFTCFDKCSDTEKENKKNIFEILFTNGADAEARDDQGMTPLMHAALNEQYDIVDFMAENRVDLDQVDPKNRTALMHAVQAKRFIMADKLMENGANPNLVNQQNETALMISTQDENLRVAGFLIEYPQNVNIVNHEGMSPLMFFQSELDKAIALRYPKVFINRYTEFLKSCQESGNKFNEIISTQLKYYSQMLLMLKLFESNEFSDIKPQIMKFMFDLIVSDKNFPNANKRNLSKDLISINQSNCSLLLFSQSTKKRKAEDDIADEPQPQRLKVEMMELEVNAESKNENKNAFNP